MSTFYIAARPSKRTELVRELSELLKKRGFESALDWVDIKETGRVSRPYADYPNESERIGDAMLNAANSDIFILLHEPDLEGALMEYGVARYGTISNPQKRIAVLNLGARDSIFLHHKNVTLLSSIKELKCWIENL